MMTFNESVGIVDVCLDDLCCTALVKHKWRWGIIGNITKDRHLYRDSRSAQLV